MKLKLMLIAACVATLASSCSEEEFPVANQYVPKGAYDSGVLVLNQGAFTDGIATISYVGYSSGIVENNIYASANAGAALGNTAQDMAFAGDNAYIVLNGSDKIEIANRYTMKKTGTITGFRSPRYIVIDGGKAYVSNWGDGFDTTDDYIAVVDLTSQTITATIPVTEGPEKLLLSGGKLYVAHYGGYGFGNTLSVIDTASSSVTATINVGDLPTAMQIDNGILWVACQGKPDYSGSESAGKLQKIDLSTNTVISSLTCNAVTKHIGQMGVVNAVAYYTIGSDVYRFDSTTENVLPTNKAFSTEAVSIFGFSIMNDRMYIADAKDFNSAGQVFIYSMGTPDIAQGTLLSSYTVGLLPCGFYFNL